MLTISGPVSFATRTSSTRRLRSSAFASWLTDCPVAFRRPAGNGALPTPVRGGTIDELRPFVNVANDADFRLLVSWSVMGLSPRGDYPVLALLGQHGSAKSTTMQSALCLLDPPDDPEKDEASGAPAGEDDLCVQCHSVRVVAFDNVSSIPQWLADAMCRIATGGSWRKRKLYSDLGQTLVRVCLPIVLTSITDVLAKRADLLDRSVVLRLPTLSGEQRQQYRLRRRQWAAVQPRVLGALLDGVVAALRNKDALEASMDTSPRMGDFLLWAAAAAPAFGWTAKDVIEAYEQNREGATAVALDNQVIYTHFCTVVRQAGGKWRGTAAKLLVLLQGAAEAACVRTTGLFGWPRSPAALGATLMRIAPSLRDAGWTVVEPGACGGRRGRNWFFELPAEEATGEQEGPTEPTTEPGTVCGWLAGG